MIKILDDYDWKQAFGYAGEPDTDGRARLIKTISEPDISLEPFTREDVQDIYGLDGGVHDEIDWVIYGKLKDGRYFFLKAGCDLTGWDCQADGITVVSDSKEDIERFGLDREARERFNIEL